MQPSLPKKTKQQIFMETLNKRRREKASNMITDALKIFLEHDMPIHDIYYVERRLREVLENAVSQVDFEVAEILALKRKMLKEALSKAVVSLPKPRGFTKNPKDLTAIRDKRCEPIVYKLLELVMKEELLLTDEEYTRLAVKEENATLFMATAMAYLQALFEGVQFSAEQSSQRANKILWDGKDKEQITYGQMHKILMDAAKPKDEK